MLDLALIVSSLPQLLKGAIHTLEITFIAIFIGLTFGTLLSFVQTAGGSLARTLVYIYVSLIRGTPMLVQIFFLFYVLPQCGVTIPPFWAASIAIGCNSSAYISQTLQSGINSVSVGQIEAAKALGLNKKDTMFFIVLPQAFRTVTPSLGNELITLVKDSSLASLIGVLELTKEASIIRSQTYDAFSILLAVAGIYLFLTTSLSYLFKKLNQKLGTANNVKSFKIN